MMLSSAIAAPPQFLAGDRVDDPLDVRGRQRRRAAGGVPGLQQAERDEGVDVMAQQMAGEPCKAAVAGAFADALDQRAPFRGQRRADGGAFLLGQ